MANGAMTAFRTLAPIVLATLTACGDAARPAPARVFVSNEDDGTVSVIDTRRHEVTATIAVGKRPRGLRVSPDRHYLYVALSGSPRSPPGVDEATLPPPDRSADGIGVVDLATLRLVRTLPSGQDPESFDLAGDLLVVSNEDSGQAAIVDRASGELRGHVAIGGEPEGVTTAPDGTVWITCEADGRVDVVEPRSRQRLAGITVGGRPRSIVFTRDGAKAYVANELDATVSVIDVAARRAVRTIALPPREGVPRRPMGLARSRDGATIYVSTGRGGDVVTIRTATDELGATFAKVAPRPWGLAVAPDGQLYVAGGPSNDVAVIDPARGEVVARIATGALPWGVAVDR